MSEIVGLAYDPAVAGLLADAHADGEVLELSWADVGPAAARASWDSYRHEIDDRAADGARAGRVRDDAGGPRGLEAGLRRPRPGPGWAGHPAGAGPRIVECPGPRRGEATAPAAWLTGSLRDQVLAEAHGRRHTMVCALLQIIRSQAPTDREETILDQALKVLDDRHTGVPILADLLEVIRDAPDSVRQVALDRGNLDRYRDLTEHLEASLIGLINGGRLGQIFASHTTAPMQLDRPVVFDLSSISDADTDLQAAALLACWSYGFGAINIANVLADAGLEPRRHYFIVLDELWRALRAGQGMVDRVDALTRLNRTWGVGTAMISHTMADLTALASPADREKARGFVERSGMVIAGGLPRGEMERLNSAVSLSRAEEDMLVSWSAPPSWDAYNGSEGDPSGRGKFMVKVGGKAGVPVHVGLTSVEREINDTNKRWQHLRAGGPMLEPGPRPAL